MLRVDIPGVPPLAAFNIDGEVYCTSNVCTHQLAILTDGFFESDVVECPLHGGTFNVRTGAAMEFPCKIPLRTYPVIAVDGDLYIDVE
jgi:ethylbenzene dioxygenase ferredoxin subunit